MPWRGEWNTDGGGATVVHGIHQFDLLLSILGPWAAVSAMAGRLARDTAAEDASVAVVRFDNGALATIVNSVLSPREVSALRIDYERATVELNHLYSYTSRDWTITPAPGHQHLVDLWHGDGSRNDVASGHRAQLVRILDALDAGRPAPVPLSEARHTMELAAASYASAFEGRPVRRGEIGTSSPFYRRMDGPGAPWNRADITGS